MSAQDDHLSAHRFPRTAGGLHSTVRQTLANLHGSLAPHAQKVLDSGWVTPTKRIFNNAQVSDHFAIIPTTHEAKHLDEMEARVFDMIARRFIAAFYPPAEFDITTRTSTVAGHDFKTEGKVLTVPGGSPSTAGRPSTTIRLIRKPCRRSRRPTASRRRPGPSRPNCTAKPPNRRRATPKPRCSPRWKAPASWWMTRTSPRP